MQNMQTHHQNELAFDDRVTEIILPNLSMLTDSLLLPIIAKLSQPNDQWLTWVSALFPDKQKLINNGVNIKQLRTIKADTDYSLVSKALAIGNSHTVIAEVDYMTIAQRQTIEQAALCGDTNVILVRHKG